MNLQYLTSKLYDHEVSIPVSILIKPEIKPQYFQLACLFIAAAKQNINLNVEIIAGYIGHNKDYTRRLINRFMNDKHINEKFTFKVDTSFRKYNLPDRFTVYLKYLDDYRSANVDITVFDPLDITMMNKYLTGTKRFQNYNIRHLIDATRARDKEEIISAIEYTDNQKGIIRDPIKYLVWAVKHFRKQNAGKKPKTKKDTPPEIKFIPPDAPAPDIKGKYTLQIKHEDLFKVLEKGFKVLGWPGEYQSYKIYFVMKAGKYRNLLTTIRTCNIPYIVSQYDNQESDAVYELHPASYKDFTLTKLTERLSRPPRLANKLQVKEVG